jgi:hypothetical protein
MLSTLEWNTEFKRLNGIPPSKGMDLSAASTREYFMAISRNGGYKMPVEPSATPAPIPTISGNAGGYPISPTISGGAGSLYPPPQNATAKQLIKTIIDAAAALDKL